MKKSLFELKKRKYKTKIFSKITQIVESEPSVQSVKAKLQECWKRKCVYQNLAS